MSALIETLPLLQRLALSYAPGRMREPTLALLALDNRLADVVRTASEPMLAQIRLAWWRDMLARDPGERPAGEPLLAALETWGREGALLGELVDGWEHLVGGEPLDDSAIAGFCAGRGGAFAALADRAGRAEARPAARAAGEQWALADLAARLDDPAERERALDRIAALDWKPIALPRELRPIAVLHGLALRAGRAGEGLGPPTRGALATALRIGLFGR